MAKNVVIASAVRTPFTRAKRGELRETRPDTMAVWVIKEAIARVPGLKPEDIDDVILGCAMPEAEQGMNVARIAAIGAGLPNHVSAMTINRFCCSGVQSTAIAAWAIQAGSIDVAVTGGTETMSMIPMGGNKITINPEIFEQYPEIYSTMGATAENVAERYGITREEMDLFAFDSQRKAAEAQAAGKFKQELMPVDVVVYGTDGKPQQIHLTADTINRPDTTLEGLTKLRGAFRQGGEVTAGNSSPLTDGAGATVVMSEERAEKMGIKPLAYFRHYVTVGVPPEIMGVGPLYAIPKLLEQVGMTKEDIDVFEVNEAFASQAFYCCRELGLDMSKTNPNGGAIAMGHPLGSTGARLVATIIYELKRRGGKYGVVSMCIGGGMGAAALIENIP
ncbi:MAG: thiolase family protein [Bradymonadales bacterium]|nr:thiolase family protein [Bradymonadales bacterium]